VTRPLPPLLASSFLSMESFSAKSGDGDAGRASAGSVELSHSAADARGMTRVSVQEKPVLFHGSESKGGIHINPASPSLLQHGLASQPWQPQPLPPLRGSATASVPSLSADVCIPPEQHNPPNSPGDILAPLSRSIANSVVHCRYVMENTMDYISFVSSDQRHPNCAQAGTKVCEGLHATQHVCVECVCRARIRCAWVRTS
jgi:hypothetical protein